MFATATAPRIYSDDEVDELLKHGSKKLLYVFDMGPLLEHIFGENHYTKICRLILWMADGTTTAARNYGKPTNRISLAHRSATPPAGARRAAIVGSTGFSNQRLAGATPRTHW